MSALLHVDEYAAVASGHQPTAPALPPKQPFARFLPQGDWVDSDGKPLHLDDLLARGLLVRLPDRVLADTDGELFTQPAVMSALWSARAAWKNHVARKRAERTPGPR